MTIKELEARIHMTRANIRFYEAQGLLKPVRGENGYREYSEEDLAVLQKIFLLRSLGMSLEEIREAQSGGKELSALLQARQEALEKEQLRLEACLRVCREMREDQVRYDTLDAQKYLRSISVAESVPLPASDQVKRPWIPWRRFFARLFDLFLLTLFWAMSFACFCSRAFLRAFPFEIAAMITMLFLEPLLLRLFGTTPGKWIMGIRVTDDADGRLSYSKGFIRTFKALWWGTGMGIPIFSIVRLFMSYYTYYKEKTLSWEYDSEETIRENKIWRGMGIVGVSAVLIFCFTAELSYLKKPLHSGNLTVAQFAENYNHYQWYYFGGETSGYLDREGQPTARKPQDSHGIIVNVSDIAAEKPVITYTEKDGAIVEISMEIRWEETGIFWAGTDRIPLMLYSFLLARPEWSHREVERIGLQILDDPLEDFHTEARKIEITYEAPVFPEYVQRLTMKKID